MNILLFTAIYPTNEDSGIPRDTKAIHYFAKQWVKLGHKVEIIYLYQNPLKRMKLAQIKNIFKPKVSDYWYEGIHVNLFETQLFIPHADKALNFQMLFLEKAFRKVISQKLKNFKPDLITMHFPMSFYGCEILKDFNCPTIAVLHNCDINIAKKIKKDRVLLYLKKFKKLGSRNKKIKLDLVYEYNLESDIVYSGIAEELISSKSNIANKKFLQNSICNITFVGNLLPLKKVDNLLNAAKKFEFDYKIIIVGDGPEKNKLIELSKNLEIEDKIVFTGRLTREESIEVMKKSDVFVMTSSPETFGLVYLEAMSQGCITIGSKNEGIDGVIINNYNGYLVEPNNTNELSKLLNNIYLLSDEDKKRISSNGYETASGMTSAKMAERYLNLIINKK